MNYLKPNVAIFFEEILKFFENYSTAANCHCAMSGSRVTHET